MKNTLVKKFDKSSLGQKHTKLHPQKLSATLSSDLVFSSDLKQSLMRNENLTE